jgi:hypothetical protein
MHRSFLGSLRCAKSPHRQDDNFIWMAAALTFSPICCAVILRQCRLSLRKSRHGCPPHLSVILRKWSRSPRERLPTKDPCISRCSTITHSPPLRRHPEAAQAFRSAKACHGCLPHLSVTLRKRNCSLANDSRRRIYAFSAPVSPLRLAAPHACACRGLTSTVILRKWSRSPRERLPTKDLCISRAVPPSHTSPVLRCHSSVPPW